MIQQLAARTATVPNECSFASKMTVMPFADEVGRIAFTRHKKICRFFVATIFPAFRLLDTMKLPDSISHTTITGMR